jgi:hypothetical protein
LSDNLVASLDTQIQAARTKPRAQKSETELKALRKPIICASDEKDYCPLCLDQFIELDDSLTFCHNCGYNVHQACWNSTTTKICPNCAAVDLHHPSDGVHFRKSEGYVNLSPQNQKVPNRGSYHVRKRPDDNPSTPSKSPAAKKRKTPSDNVTPSKSPASKKQKKSKDSTPTTSDSQSPVIPFHCATCNKQIAQKQSYTFRRFAGDYKVIYPGSPFNDGDKVCSRCYKHCFEWRKHKTEESQTSQQESQQSQV